MEEGVAYRDGDKKKSRKYPSGLIAFIYDKLGEDRFGDGLPSPPGSNQELDFGIQGEELITEYNRDGYQYSACTYNDDGFDLWINQYSKDEWIMSLDQKQSLRLAWFIIWTWWIKGKWFGLRRVIWYWALHKIVEGNKRFGKQ